MCISIVSMEMGLSSVKKDGEECEFLKCLEINSIVCWISNIWIVFNYNWKMIIMNYAYGLTQNVKSSFGNQKSLI